MGKRGAAGWGGEQGKWRLMAEAGGARWGETWGEEMDGGGGSREEGFVCGNGSGGDGIGGKRGGEQSGSSCLAYFKVS